MAYKNKVRVSVPLSPEIDERLIKLCEKMCISKSSLCAFLISQQLDTYEISVSLMQDPIKLQQFQNMLNTATEEQLNNMSKDFEKEKKE